MEPNVVPRRRPTVVDLLAVFADVAGICYLTAAVTGLLLGSFREKLAFAGIGLYGLSRLFASYGLRTMRRWGAILERVSACVWIAASAILIVKVSAVPALLLIPGAAVAVFEFWYLGRAPMTEPGVPMSVGFRVGWTATIVVGVLLLLAIVVTSVMPGGSHQKRTMADMRTIATAWEARATDYNRYNAAGITFPMGGVTVNNLITFLSPTYVKTIPLKDGWGHDWAFGVDAPWGSKAPAQIYVIVSYGKDGKSQRKWAGGATTDFNCDIIYSNGTFLQYPEGVQQQ